MQKSHSSKDLLARKRSCSLDNSKKIVWNPRFEILRRRIKPNRGDSPSRTSIKKSRKEWGSSESEETDSFILELEASNRQNCSVCCEYKAIEEFVSFPICLHRFCKACVEHYFFNAVSTRPINNILCMDYLCTRPPLRDDELEQLIPKAMRMRLEYFRSYRKACADPEARLCIKEGCCEVVKKTGKSQRLVCACGQEFCFSCLQPWHERKSCNKAILSRFNLYKNKKNIKKCPSCKSFIEREGGCNHIKCSMCNYEFCWLCMGKYTTSHYRKYNVLGCPGRLFEVSTGAKSSCNCRLILLFLLKQIARGIYYLTLPITIVIYTVFIGFYNCFNPQM